MIEIATEKRYSDNQDEKHRWNAKYGWYRYDARFAIPISDNENEIVGYNVFKTTIIVRHSQDGKMYLYDILNIKKRNEVTLWSQKTLLGKNSLL